jgi:hypothetical protein
MANPAISAKVECPFFVETELNKITCESYIPQTECEFVFQNLKARRDYMHKVCCNNLGKKCMHYRTMMIMYERGVLNGNT